MKQSNAAAIRELLEQIPTQQLDETLDRSCMEKALMKRPSHKL